MRDLNLLKAHRAPEGVARKVFGDDGDGCNGLFEIASKTDGKALRIIATAGGGWDHVSISRRDRCPNWHEMEQIKRLFFADHETAMQLHVAVTNHVNMHPNCLHLWRPHDLEIPLPPASMV